MARPPRPFQDLRSLVGLFRVLKRFRPDVLVYATPKASLLASIAGAILGIQVRVYEIWGLRLETSAGPWRWLLSGLEWLTSVLSTDLLANSRSLAVRYQQRGLAAGKTVLVLGDGSSHGVNLEEFNVDAHYPRIDPGTAAFLKSTSGLVVGFIGRLHPDKGIDTLLEAIHVCVSRGIPMRALLVGVDEGASIDLTTEIDSKVRSVGQVDDPRPYYEAMDVLVLVSRREGFPNVVLEAAAMKTPAIVADSTGTVDSVEDGATGLIIPVGDAIALANALEALSLSPVRVQFLGTQARARAVNRYRQTDVWERHASFIRTSWEATAQSRVRQ